MESDGTWLQDLKLVLGWLSPRRRTQLGLLLGLSIAGAVAELATIGAVIPFLAMLSDPDSVLRIPLMGRLLGNIDWITSTRLITVVTITFGTIVIVSSSIRLALAWATAEFSQIVGYDLSLRVFDRTLYQPYSYHTSRNTSEIISGIEKISLVVGGVFTPALDVFIATLMSVTIMGGLLFFDPVVAVVAGGILGILYWTISRFAQEKLSTNSRIMSANATTRVQVMQEGLGGIRDILLDGTQDLHLDRFQKADRSLRLALVRNTLWSVTPRYATEALGIGIIAMLAAISAQKQGGLADALPILGTLALGAQKLLPLLQRVYAGWTSVLGNRGYLADVAALANAPKPGAAETAGDPQLLPFTRELTLSGIGFRYATDTPWVIRNLDIEIPKGACVGFVGETGCGKSTLLDLIMGLLSPTEGEFRVDGEPLTAQNIRHWQARISHVPQNIFLADASIMENIAFGQTLDRIDAAKLKKAAHRARIHDFIESLEHGYKTKVGERGVRLSGGQRQRIGMARALYRNADLLVLDEATSALDNETEASVMEGIAQLGSEITVLIVAHRLSTLNECDLIVTMSVDGITIKSATNKTTRRLRRERFESPDIKH